MALTPGTRLGPYQIVSALGAGGMGEVYRARDTRLDRTVAIKVLPQHVAADPVLKQRFEREARTVAALNHPRICTLYDIGREGNTEFLVMECLDGETLAQRLERGALPLNEALRYAVHIADALDQTHRQGIIHRDLKPGNVMLTEGGAKLLDFGLAKRTASDVECSEATTRQSVATATGVRLGSPGYMAPEQLLGGPVDERSDLFAFGILVTEMLTGVHPFARGSAADTMAAILRDPPARPSGLTNSLTTLIAKLLAKEPNSRPSSFREVLVALGSSAPSASAASTPGWIAGERRVATVLVASVSQPTGDRDDDEEDQLRACGEALAALQRIVQRHAGTVLDARGDGIVAMFGAPVAQEDATVRAVRAAREMAADLPSLGAAVRVGVHRGRVVIEGRESSGVRVTPMADTLRVAMRLEANARLGDVVLSARAASAVGDYFVCEPDEAGAARVVRAKDADSRFEAMHPAGLTPFVGRDEEIALLLNRWEQAKSHEGQVVLLEGEPGMGKSRITRSFRELISRDAHIRVQYQCSLLHTNSALYPFISQLERAARFHPEDTPDRRLDKLETLFGTRDLEGLALLGSLLSLSVRRYPALAMTPQRQKERTIELFVQWLVALADQAPVLVVVEDVHWIDPTSREALNQIITAIDTRRILMIVTFRREFEAPWGAHGHVTLHSLNRLGRRQSALMVDRVTGDKPLPDELREHIVSKADGVPLFIEELTKAVLDSGLVTDQGDRYQMSGAVEKLAIPDTLHDSLMARLDKLIPVKEVAQVGAAIGREFSHELLSALSPMSARDVNAALDTLVASELVHRRGTPPHATYTFKHALVQDAAYDSLLKRDRQDLHRRIAEALLDKFSSLIESQPELLAHHYTAAGLPDRAVPYWLQAGQHALRRSALLEAVRHLTHGLELLLSLPAGSARNRRELDFQSALGTAYLACKGWASPEAGAAYTRAAELARLTTDPKLLLTALWGLFAFNLVRGDMHATRANVEELLACADCLDDLELLVVAKMALADGAYWRSEFDTMRGALLELYGRYEPKRHGTLVKDLNHDPKAIVQLYEAQALWVQGYPDQAVRRCEEERALSHQIGHPFNLCFSLTWGAMPYVFCKDVVAFLERLEAGLAIARDQRLEALVAWGPWFEGWALAQRGQLEEGIARMRQGIAGWHAVGAGLAVPYCRTFLAEFLGLAGRPEQGLEEIARVEAQIGRWGEVIAESEAQRVKGELLLRRSPPDMTAAEAYFQRALDTARCRKAKSWELRVAVSLARLWRSEGKRQEAYALLSPVYGWFTEGFDTADLKEAKALLDDLT